jgi:deoxyribodipyrimidine photo-lyase
LHFGEISPRQAWAAAKTEPYRRQLVWREFAHHLLYHFPHTPEKPLRPAFENFPWRTDAHGLQAWQRGCTGFPLVDAGMRELWTTGWMHNRVRMTVASFLVKDLLIRWQDGAQWFWETLVDADLANNTLGWQWVAGCGADAAPFFRIFNPATQAEKFDPQNNYIRRWVKETIPPILDHAIARKRALTALKRSKA